MVTICGEQIGRHVSDSFIKHSEELSWTGELLQNSGAFDGGSSIVLKLITTQVEYS
jgi:hypothetical protein